MLKQEARAGIDLADVLDHQRCRVAQPLHHALVERAGEKADFQLIEQSTIFLLEPLTDAARAWVQDHISADAIRFGPAIVVEHRCLADIVTGIALAGLSADRVSS